MTHLYPLVTYLSAEEKETIHQAVRELEAATKERDQHLATEECLGETRPCSVCVHHATAFNHAVRIIGEAISKNPELRRLTSTSRAHAVFSESSRPYQEILRSETLAQRYIETVRRIHD